VFTTIAVQIVIAIVLALVAHAMQPSPKRPKDESVTDLEVPTAEAGRPIPVVFGEGIIKSPNTLWYGQTQVRYQRVSL